MVLDKTADFDEENIKPDNLNFSMENLNKSLYLSALEETPTKKPPLKSVLKTPQQKPKPKTIKLLKTQHMKKKQQEKTQLIRQLKAKLATMDKQIVYLTQLIQENLPNPVQEKLKTTCLGDLMFSPVLKKPRRKNLLKKPTDNQMLNWSSTDEKEIFQDALAVSDLFEEKIERKEPDNQEENTEETFELPNEVTPLHSKSTTKSIISEFAIELENLKTENFFLQEKNKQLELSLQSGRKVTSTTTVVVRQEERQEQEKDNSIFQMMEDLQLALLESNNQNDLLKRRNKELELAVRTWEKEMTKESNPHRRKIRYLQRIKEENARLLQHINKLESQVLSHAKVKSNMSKELVQVQFDKWNEAERHSLFQRIWQRNVQLRQQMLFQQQH